MATDADVAFALTRPLRHHQTPLTRIKAATTETVVMNQGFFQMGVEDASVDEGAAVPAFVGFPLLFANASCKSAKFGNDMGCFKFYARFYCYAPTFRMSSA